MKKTMIGKLLCQVAAISIMAGVSNGAVAINMEYGALRDASGDVLANTESLWAVIVATTANGSTLFPGNLEVNSSLTQPEAAFDHFSGESLVAGQTFGPDHLILAVGFVNDPDAVATPSVVAELELGVETGRNFAFYWFPGLTTHVLPKVEFEIGGFQTLTGDFLTDGMTIPSDGATVTSSALSEDLGGSVTAQTFTAINAIPEPSSVGLALLGVFGLMARRRR